MASSSTLCRRQALAHGARCVVGGALGWGGCGLRLQSAAAQPASPTGPSRGDLIRWPTVRLLDQRTWGPSDAAGRVMVVVFFSTSCPYCLRHNRRLTKLAELVDRQVLQVLGVAHETDPDRVRRHLREQGHRFDVTLDDQPMHQALSARRSVPLTCVVDRASRLRELIPGEMAEDDVLGLARWGHR